MPEPLITTIIPTYRRPAFLKCAIDSVLQQSYPHCRVLVLDNASGDDTGAVVTDIARADRRVEYVCQPKNLGAVRNFNDGLDRVRTPFFSILSDDDYLLPQFFEQTMAAHARHPDSTFVVAGTRVVDTDSGEVVPPSREGLRPGYYQPPDGAMAMVRRGAPLWTGVLFRRQCLDVGLRLDPRFTYGSDFVFCMEAALRYPFRVISHEGAVFRKHADGYSADPEVQELWGFYRHMLTRTWTDEGRLNDRVLVRFRNALGLVCRRHFGGIVRDCLANGRHDDAVLASRILLEHLDSPSIGRMWRLVATGVRDTPLAGPLASVAHMIVRHIYRWMSRRRQGGPTNRSEALD